MKNVLDVLKHVHVHTRRAQAPPPYRTSFSLTTVDGQCSAAWTKDMTRSSYTVDFKLSVVEWLKNGGRSLREASKQFGVDRKCIRQWVREKAVLGSARLQRGPQKRKLHEGRGPLSQDLDRLVLGYFLERRRLGFDVTDEELRKKALCTSQLLGLEDFKASSSWLKGWKCRSGIVEPLLSERSAAELLLTPPVGSSLISHVTPSDVVLLSLSPGKPISCQDDDKPNYPSSACGLDQSIPSSSSHVTSHVITPDHTYCREAPTMDTNQLSVVTSLSHLTSDLSTSNGVSPYIELSMSGHLLESADRLLSNPTSSYCSVQSMSVPGSDPVMSSTQVVNFCELEINLDSPELNMTSDGMKASRETLLSPLLVSSSSSLASLSPPKRTSVDSRALLWPSLGPNHTSPITFPEFHDFTDPLTGLLANRRSQPVFSAGPEILMSNSETS